MNFDAFGNRREPSTWLPPVGATETQADHNADRYGFTHQEMLDNVNLIHMNGRVYDPSLGRFLSVDPVFEFPTNTQSLNPYSYVLNNPLSMTDPTGYVTCNTGQTSCPDSSPETKSVSYTPTGSHIAITVTATRQADGSYAVTSNNPQMAQAIAHAAQAMFGSNGQQNRNNGPGSGADLGKTAQNGSLAHNTGGVAANTNAATGSQMVQQQQVDNVGVGKTTVGDLSKVLTNEIGSLSTPKGGYPKELENGEAALANALINNANKARPNEVAPDTGTASLQLVKAMRDAYTNRAHGGVDPVHGRTFYGTSHIPPNRLHSRPIGNSRQTVYAHFGPFKDSTSRLPTYIYIYNDPGH